MIRVLINLFIMLLYYGFSVSIKKYKIYQRINNLGLQKNGSPGWSKLQFK